MFAKKLLFIMVLLLWNKTCKLSYIVLLLTMATAFSQVKKPLVGPKNYLSDKEVKVVFPDSIKQKFNMGFFIFRVYHYTDTSGKYYLALTENIKEITAEKDTLYNKIRAIHFKNEPKGLVKQWEINDFTINEETSMWFWTKFSGFHDLDKDGLTDIIIPYGTEAVNGFSDGRIKILLFYKGQKIALRHQNGVLDNERNTQVDAAFYMLPDSIQQNIKKKMEQMMEAGAAIFPYRWQENMKKKKLYFDEN